MNDQYQPQQEFIPTQPVKKNAAYYRTKARQALKPCFGNSILVSLIAGLFGATGGALVSFDTTSLESSTGNMTEGTGTITPEALMDEIMPMLPFLIGGLIVGALFALAFALFVTSPVMLGYQRYNLNVIDGKGNEEPVGTLFSYFKTAYKKSVGLHLLYTLITFLTALPLLLGTGFLGYAAVRFATASDQSAHALLFVAAFLVFFACLVVSVVLMILVEYRYAFCFMIMAEYPEIRAIDALRNSATLMKGNKWRLFCLHFSFIGWSLLATLVPFGIGMIFLSPYLNAATAAFYDDIANRTAAKEAEFPSLDPDDYRVDEQDWWTQQQ